ncbi:uncharacterized protein [Diadema antillarum]|uniref:uncharacterized protein isoform X2 n=1 Tax=Diadema antillarum TaxID=105358 RepID=UPI003A85D9D2
MNTGSKDSLALGPTKNKVKMESTIKYVLLCGTVLLCFITSVSGQCRPPDCYLNEAGEPTSCHTCGIGRGVAVRGTEFQECQSSPVPRNTECESCIPGVNYSDVDDGRNKCRKCVPCNEETQDTVEECTVEKNTVCECKPGIAYYDEERGTCALCHECLQGEEEISPCNKTHDRRCARIIINPPEETTTEADNTTTPCVSSTSDMPTPVPPSETGGEDNTKEDGKIINILVPVVVAALVAALVAVFCAMYRRARQVNRSGQDGRTSAFSVECGFVNCCGKVVTRPDTTRQVSTVSSQTPSPTTSTPNGTQLEQIPFLQNGGVANGGLANGRVANGGPHAPNSAEHHEIVMNGHGALPTAPQPMSHQMEEVFPARIRSDLITALNAPDTDHRDWRVIAQDCLGVTTRDCTAWEQSNPGERLLHTWESAGKTLQEFKDKLHSMHRDDIMEICERVEGHQHLNGNAV